MKISLCLTKHLKIAVLYFYKLIISTMPNEAAISFLV